jgi:purine-binding chemotaxis protein CheW
MDFLSIRKKARERAEAKEASPGAPRPAPEPQPQPQPQPSGAGERAPTVEERADPRERREERRRPQTMAPPLGLERRRTRGDEPVLTDSDLAEGALQAQFQGLEPSSDGRFATWRPGSGPPPVEPDPRVFGGETAPASDEEGPRRPLPGPEAEPEPEPERAPARRSAPVVPAAPLDPLDEFFYRPDEEAAIVPLLGSPLPEEPPPAAPTAIDEFLTFLLDREEYAVPIGRVREVLRAPAITEVPRAPAHVMGVVTVRGEVVAVIDARSRLGLGRTAGAQSRIVIVDAGEGPLGLLVDQVSSVVRLPRGSIEPCPQGISAAASDCVTGIGRWRDRLFMVVDVEALLGRPRPAGDR